MQSTPDSSTAQLSLFFDGEHNNLELLFATICLSPALNINSSLHALLSHLLPSIVYPFVEFSMNEAIPPFWLFHIISVAQTPSTAPPGEAQKQDAPPAIHTVHAPVLPVVLSSGKAFVLHIIVATKVIGSLCGANCNT